MLRLTFVTKSSVDPQRPSGNNPRTLHGRIFAPLEEVIELVIADSKVLEIEAGDAAASDREFPRLPKGKD
jgi:hypothetical protein